MSEQKPEEGKPMLAIVDRNGKVLDDHGTTLIFPNETKAEQYLQPQIREWLKQQFGRTWLAPYKPSGGPLKATNYASGKGRPIN